MQECSAGRQITNQTNLGLRGQEIIASAHEFLTISYHPRDLV